MALKKGGVECRTITGAGTGSYQFELQSGIYTEVQPGSYVFMDADYAKNEIGSDASGGQFEHSLFVYAQVMSTPARGTAVVDAGLKALAFDSGPPRVVGFEGVEYRKASDEHGILESSGARRPPLGAKVRLVPGHCDPTVNLYDWIVGVRQGCVAELWAVIGRGSSR